MAHNYKKLFSIVMEIDWTSNVDDVMERFFLKVLDAYGFQAGGLLLYRDGLANCKKLELEFSFPKNSDAVHGFDLEVETIARRSIADVSLFESELPMEFVKENGSGFCVCSIPRYGVLIFYSDKYKAGKDILNEIDLISPKLSAVAAEFSRNKEHNTMPEMIQSLKNDLAVSEKRLQKTVMMMAQAQNELDIQMNHLALILQSLGEGVIVANSNQNIDLVNVKALEYLNYMPSSSEGLSLNLLVQNCRGKERLLSSIDSDDFDGHYDLIVEGRHGQNRILRVTQNRLGKILSAESEMIYLLMDVTKEKEVDRLKNEFISNLSHELRTPMNAILGISHVLAEKNSDNLSNHQKQGLHIINESGQRLLTLINDLLDISKIESGKMEIVLGSCNLYSMVSNIKNSIEALIPENVLFKTEIDDCIPEIICTDEGRLQQVILNLLGNSFKFTERGSVCLRIFSEEDYLHFEVSDTGIGISKENIPLIFDRFKQIDGSSSRRYEGTGLGLSLSREIVRLMGGGMAAKSVEGEGTTVSFTIPSAKSFCNGSADKDDKIERKDKLQHCMGENRPSVLLIDDDEGNRELVKLYLSDQCTVITASDGLEGIERFRSAIPDLVLLDIMMPTPDGYDVLETLKEINSKVPVIAFTARAMKGEREKILSRGFDEYISKPVDVNAFYAVIENFLKEKQK